MEILVIISECKSMQVYLLLWALLTTLTGEGYISALTKHPGKEATRIPKIRHKTFSFDEDDSESDAVEENTDIESKANIQQPKAQPSRSSGKPKSILEKLVREPELGKN